VSTHRPVDAADPTPSSSGWPHPTGGDLPEASALAERPTDVRMRIESFAVAVAVPAHEDIDPVEYGGRTILDALSLHGITVAAIAHHDDPGPLFPRGFDGTGGPATSTESDPGGPAGAAAATAGAGGGTGAAAAGGGRGDVDPGAEHAGTGAAAGGDSMADATADPDADLPTDEDVVEPVDETGSTSGSPRDR
jgi:hypothetical protein